jgi:hypothetical protein
MIETSMIHLNSKNKKAKIEAIVTCASVAFLVDRNYTTHDSPLVMRIHLCELAEIT